MSVILETTKGDISIDLFYNGVLFYNVQKDFVAQTGDPTGTGKGGSSVFGLVKGEQHRFFKDEISRKRTHAKAGTVAMANAGIPNTNGSQFYFTLRDGLDDQLDGKNTVFGEVVDGFEVLEQISNAYVDDKGRPFIDIRITHTMIVDDPTDDVPGLECPDESPDILKPKQETVPERLQEGDDIDGNNGRTEEEIEQALKRQEAQTRARTLEILGDLPDADVAPPENVLFVCKLNPVTKDQDLEMIFSRFGEILSCEIIRDYKTGDSLNYAFIEFANKEDCEEAYFKMNNVLIDQRRIKVDFSQSVSKQWNKWMRSKRGGPGASGRPTVTSGRVHGRATRLHLNKEAPRFGGKGKYDLLVGDAGAGKNTGRRPRDATRDAGSGGGSAAPARSQHQRQRRPEPDRRSDERDRDRGSRRRDGDRDARRSRDRKHDRRGRDGDRSRDRDRDHRGHRSHRSDDRKRARHERHDDRGGKPEKRRRSRWDD